MNSADSGASATSPSAMKGAAAPATHRPSSASAVKEGTQFGLPPFRQLAAEAASTRLGARVRTRPITCWPTRSPWTSPWSAAMR